ncbi:MAG: 1-acyl-sn-glycerol-3-phosphate acyltransferase [Proteobacteria bacterium]|nr:1-acyl-sn-glycerol-3-phosphate acyltransferase [Pseudomonadota bacterium]
MGRLFRRVKGGWVLFWGIVATICVGPLIMLFGMLDRSGRIAFRLCQVWCWVALTIGFVRLRVRGREKIKKGQSYVIVSNHQSLYDIPVLMNGLNIQFRWVIKKEILKIPIFGWGLYYGRNVFIDRSNTKKSIKSMRQAMRRLPAGVSVYIFAEGTRTPDGQVQEFKKGGFMMALSGNTPVLPVTVNGSWKFMSDRSTMSFTPGPIEVVVGDPIDTSGYKTKNLDELVEKTRNAVVANLNPEFPEKRVDEAAG